MSETKIIIPSIGPYAGQRMTVDAREADQAVSEGWASDPFAAPKPPKEGEAPKEPTDEERSEMAKKAEAAAKRWRGETKDPDKPEAPVTRDMAAGPGHSYETRTTAAKTETRKGR